MANIIAYGGVHSKNSPRFSEESFLLANKSKFIDGIMVDAYITSDDIILLSDEYSLLNMGIDKEYINSNSYTDILSINSGSKVKRNHLIDLNKLNDYSKNSTILLVNIIGSNKNDKILTEIRNFIKNTNMEVYLYSKSSQITEMLLESKINAKIGISISSKITWNYSFDFYVVDDFWINNDEISRKLFDGCKIFIGVIDKLSSINKLKKELGNNFDKCYLISRSPNIIKKYV